jgi:hypothetical protein
MLRHTFCSIWRCWLLLRERIRNWRDLRTSRRRSVIHLSPGATDSAIRLLQSPQILARRGNIVATGMTETAKS